MTCENCDPSKFRPGKLVKATKDLTHCALCGEEVISISEYANKESIKRWDKYFHSICIAVSSKSPCLSRKIGAILVRGHSVVATGYNGPARGIPHCGRSRYIKDKYLYDDHFMLSDHSVEDMQTVCPRKLLGYESGTHMELCPAQHAEANCISNAARLGVGTVGTILYMNCVIPCKNCFGALINAGIVEVVVDDIKPYDRHTQFQTDNSDIKIREFEL